MLTRKPWFVASSSLAVALALFASAPTRARADEAISNTHHPPPHSPYVSYDTVNYSMNWTGTPYCQLYTVYMKSFGVTQPSASTDAGVGQATIDGGSGGRDGGTKDFWPGTQVADGVWICYHVVGTPSDGGTLHHAYNGAYCYHPGL